MHFVNKQHPHPNEKKVKHIYKIFASQLFLSVERLYVQKIDCCPQLLKI